MKRKPIIQDSFHFSNSNSRNKGNTMEEAIYYQHSLSVYILILLRSHVPKYIPLMFPFSQALAEDSLPPNSFPP